MITSIVKNRGLILLVLGTGSFIGLVVYNILTHGISTY
jgi:hypothetical protein